jgi:dihydrofolate reductase
MSIKVIIACDLNYGIGKNKQLPWPKNEKDLKWFQKNTMGDIIVMGRKTWESIGSKCLPGRINVVVTTKNLEGPDFCIEGDIETILHTLEEKWPQLDIWIIGGSELYFQAIPHCSKLYLTIFKDIYDCDTHIESDIFTQFPRIEYWEETDHYIIQVRSR